MSSKLGDRFGSKLALGLLMLGASSKLDLTAEQRMKLEAVGKTLVDINKAHQAERAKHLDEIKREILSDRLNSAKIRSLIWLRHRFINENFDHVFGKVAEFHASLMPEQKRKAVALLEKFTRYWVHD